MRERFASFGISDLSLNCFDGEKAVKESPSFAREERISTPICSPRIVAVLSMYCFDVTIEKETDKMNTEPWTRHWKLRAGRGET
jgi:hypothetical protein